MSAASPARSETAPGTLSKAVVRAAALLGIKQAELAVILGLSTASVSRLVAGQYQLNPDRKEWDFALLFVRLFRSLDAIVGNSEDARAWLHSENSGLGSVPAALLPKTEGLVRVLHYLDANRGRI